MKTKILSIALFVLTLAVVGLYPHDRPAIAQAQPNPTIPTGQAQPGQRPKIEVVFVLDTTGSMGGLIQAAKEKIWSIATSMAQAQPAPEIRMGLVAYRDRGDAYVTRVEDLSADLDSLYAKLMDFRADGGGDGPESVNQALDDAVRKISWSQNQETYKVVFLLGDAPPHMDYPDDVKYPESLKEAARRGIVVNAIQCGTLPDTTQSWRQIAQLGQGEYFQVGQAGGAVAVSSPYDKKLAELSAKLDETRLYYGDAADKLKSRLKQEATDKLHALASPESRARRATFNASASGAANQAGEKELVEDVGKGRVDVSKMDSDKLPASLQAVAPEKRQAVVEEKAKERQELRQQIEELAKQRAEHLKQEVDKQGGAKDSLDEKVYGAVREQAAKKGLSYAAPAPAY